MSKFTVNKPTMTADFFSRMKSISDFQTLLRRFQFIVMYIRRLEWDLYLIRDMFNFLLEKNFGYFGCNQPLEIQSNIEIYEKKNISSQVLFFSMMD